MQEVFDIDTNGDKKDFQKINKIMNEIITITKPYKNSNLDELKNSVIKIIKDSKIEPELIKNRDKETLAHL